jgi:hypothetical protein
MREDHRTLHQAAVGVMYDIIGTPLHGHRSEVEDKRTSGMSIVKIYEGRIAQSDVVIDTLPFQESHKTELSCCVM